MLKCSLLKLVLKCVVWASAKIIRCSKKYMFRHPYVSKNFKSKTTTKLFASFVNFLTKHNLFLFYLLDIFDESFSVAKII
jgi:hypothetical protein